MRVDFNIDVHHVTRIEGHGNLKIRVENGKLVECRWEIVETPRFFEALLKGKKFDVVAPITSRICGICSVGHSLASIRATERAMGIEVSPQIEKLRLLLKHGETIQSHILHMFFLVSPDLFRSDSIVPLIKNNPQTVVSAARLKKLGNDICATVGGRQTHPQSNVPGGFLKVPSKNGLQALGSRIAQAMKELDKTMEIFRPLFIAGKRYETEFSARVESLMLMGLYPFPDFSRETEYVSLRGELNYPFIGGKLISSDGIVREEDDYLSMTNEFTVEHSTAKWAKLSRRSFAVGALARFNNNYLHLSSGAKRAAAQLGLHPVCHNPFMNNIAQVVECVHCFEDSIRIIDELTAGNLEAQRIDFEVRAGSGVGAVEVPRGILYHHYDYDEGGRICRADCIIPTNQNHGNIELDLEALVREYYHEGLGSHDIEKLAQMLVRAYDPCVSCSVH